MILPIAVERRVVAFLQLDFKSPREFTVDEHEYLYVLCSRAAQAIDRTWSHEAADRARTDAESLKARADAELVERQKTEQALRASETRYRALATRTTRLHALTASLSEAASITAVTQAIVEQAHVVVGASEGELKLAGEEGWQVEPGLCSAEALSSRRPVFVGLARGRAKAILALRDACGRPGIFVDCCAAAARGKHADWRSRVSFHRAGELR